jgi:2-polyprenyl-3-methyl-5-hydroxy-6-metoxy-1,4-benzoquinol methylase
MPARTPRRCIGHHDGMSRFDAKAADWDTPERRDRAHQLADAIREHVPLTRDMRAIDIGAGTGLLGLDLLDDVGSVVLADPSEGMVQVAGTKIEASGIVDARAIRFDFPADEPPEGAPFDLAVSLLALHHIEDTVGTLRSIYDALAPGGHIALSDLDKEDGTFHDPGEPGIHHQGFEGESLVALATAAGFVDAEWRVVHELEKNGSRYGIFLLTARRPSA